MKKHFRILALLLALLFMLAACTQTADEVTDATDTQASESVNGGDEDGKKDDEKDGGSFKIEDDRYGVAQNVDGDVPTYMYYKYVGREVDTTKDATFTDDFATKVEDWYEDRYADCGHSDILFSISMHEKTEKYSRTEEQLDPDDETSKVAVDYKNEVPIRSSYLIETTTDVSLYGELFRLCREDGINPWLSFRMNDVHYAAAQTGHDDFYYRAKKEGWLIGSSRLGYWNSNPCTQGMRYDHACAYNYAIEEVREHFLGIIDKQLEMYDPYGIELDWQRAIWSFPTDTLDNIQYMDIFMEDVNELVEQYEEIYGHEIKISVRINRDIDENMYFGFDVRNWAKNDWIDVVIPSCYWGATDTDMPIAKWDSELSAYPNVEIWAGVECHVMNNSYWQSVYTLAAQTAQYLTQGADKMYLFNLFNDTKDKFEVCASLENAYKVAKRSYVVTRANCTPFTATHKEYAPLPINAKVNEPTQAVVINHGLLNYEQDTLIYVAVQGIEFGDVTADLMKVTYNGVECSFRGTSVKSYLTNSESLGIVVSYAVPKDAITADTMSGSIVFDVGMSMTINYIELTNGNTRM